MFKKIFFSLLLTSFFSSILMSCNNADDGKTYMIKMRMQKGDKFHNKNISTIEMTTSMGGNEMVMKMKNELGTAIEVIDSNKLKLTYTSAKLQMDMGTGSYDTAMNVNNKHILGRSVILTLSGNKITGVEGFGMSVDSSNKEAMQYVKNMTSKENLENMFGALFGMYPNKAVETDESWTTETMINIMDLDMLFKAEYTLTDVENNIAEIKINGTYSSNDKIMNKGKGIDMDIKGTQKGKIYIDLTDGYITKADYDMQMEGSMNANGQSIPIKMKGKYITSE